MLAESFSTYDPKLPSATIAANGRNGWIPVFRRDRRQRRGCAESGLLWRFSNSGRIRLKRNGGTA